MTTTTMTPDQIALLRLANFEWRGGDDWYKRGDHREVYTLDGAIAEARHMASEYECDGTDMETPEEDQYDRCRGCNRPL